MDTSYENEDDSVKKQNDITKKEQEFIERHEKQRQQKIMDRIKKEHEQNLNNYLMTTSDEMEHLYIDDCFRFQRITEEEMEKMLKNIDDRNLEAIVHNINLFFFDRRDDLKSGRSFANLFLKGVAFFATTAKFIEVKSEIYEIAKIVVAMNSASSKAGYVEELNRVAAKVASCNLFLSKWTVNFLKNNVHFCDFLCENYGEESNLLFDLYGLTHLIQYEDFQLPQNGRSRRAISYIMENYTAKHRYKDLFDILENISNQSCVNCNDLFTLRNKALILLMYLARSNFIDSSELVKHYCY
ncbi:hypothetical protein MHBO_002714 [Bonamia ostreae]|uniref:Uncharacterized protein n=1 Tax=Bonamia ostreae TaxID=126728 RepID=A0ABV2ANV1_9EUKA